MPVSPSELHGSWAGLVSPELLHPSLFHDVQMAQVFPDSKTFPDCIPLRGPDAINRAYLQDRQDPAFEANPRDGLKQFVAENFRIPKPAGGSYTPEDDWDIDRHMSEVWKVLTHNIPENVGSLAGLPFDFLKAAGRFREFYGEHDAPAASIGLAVQGRYDLIESMVNGCDFMLEEIGKIPNGNRTYYFDRSQRPMFFMMVDILAEHKGRKEMLHKYLPALRKEFAFWTRGIDEVTESDPAQSGMVRMPNGIKMARYWSERTTPRPEAYREDILTAQKAGLITLQSPNGVYDHAALRGDIAKSKKLREFHRDIASGATSGKDYCGDWFADGVNMHTINTTDYIPVDLNCLLKGLSDLLAEALLNEGDFAEAQRVAQFGADLQRGLDTYCLDAETGWYFNYDHVKQEQKKLWSVTGGAYPLFFGMARSDVKPKIVTNMEKHHLVKGGLLETLDGTHENWGGDNAWMVDNHIATVGLKRTGDPRGVALSQTVKQRTVAMADRVFEEMRITPEKYNAVQADRPGGGGEYKVQTEGFPLNNGPLLGIKYNFAPPSVARALAHGVWKTREARILTASGAGDN